MWVSSFYAKIAGYSTSICYRVIIFGTLYTTSPHIVKFEALRLAYFSGIELKTII